jgi:hypothetical protein
MAHKHGRMTGGSTKQTGKGEWEATIRFANGIEGTGRGASRAEAQRNAVAEAKASGGLGSVLLLGALLLVGVC